MDFTPQQIADYKLKLDIDRMIRRDLEPYQRMPQASKATHPPGKDKRRDARGSKKNVKRGPYKKQPKPAGRKTGLAASRYYRQTTTPQP